MVVSEAVRWFDRHLWVAVLAVFAVCELATLVWSRLAADPILLTAAPPRVRADLYSSLAGSSGALLGFTITAVAILVAFRPRGDSPAARETNLARVRVKLVGVLLATSAFLGTTLALSTLSIGLDQQSASHEWLSVQVLNCAVTSLVGLSLGGLGFALAVVERRDA